MLLRTALGRGWDLGVEVLQAQLPWGFQVWGRWPVSGLGLGEERRDAQVIRHLHPASGCEGVGGAVGCE